MPAIIRATAGSISRTNFDYGAASTAITAPRCNGSSTFFAARGNHHSLQPICTFFSNSSPSIRSKYHILYLDTDLGTVVCSIVQVIAA